MCGFSKRLWVKLISPFRKLSNPVLMPYSANIWADAIRAMAAELIPKGEALGVFTIYDWGNGAAAEAYNRMVNHYGIDFINRKK